MELLLPPHYAPKKMLFRVNFLNFASEKKNFAGAPPVIFFAKYQKMAKVKLCSQQALAIELLSLSLCKEREDKTGM